MTEYEILYLLSETYDRVWALIQFWSSVSFGYMILAYVAAPRLNLLIVLVLSILYIAFSMQMFELLVTHNGFSLAYEESLSDLSKTVGLKNPAAIYAVEHDPNILGATVSLFGTFFAALLYLPYSYYRGKNGNT